MTDNRTPEPQPSAKRPAPKATLGGETVEPRILLSATWIDGSNSGEIIAGSLGDDIISAMGGDDTVLGLTGNDVLRGGTGNDLLDGSLGIDFVDYSTATGSVQVNLGTGTASGADGNDTLVSIEGAIGSAYDDTLQGSSGSDTLKGGSGNDTLVGGASNDALDGGAGRDTADYSTATSAVTVDITRTSAQNTGGAGTDTLTSIERVVGSNYNDTFNFGSPVDGAFYEVDGGAGSNTIDVSGYASSAVTFGDGTMTIDMGGGQSFQIDYDNVSSIRFGDITAKVLTADTNVSSFSGTGLYIDGPQAFTVGLGGGGSIHWTYDVDTDQVSVTNASGTGTGTSLTITDLNGADLEVGTIQVSRDLGSLTSNVDIDEIRMVGSDHSIATITIRGGAGTLGTFQTTGKLDSDTTICANVTTVLIGSDVESDLVVTGNVGSLSIDKLKNGASIEVGGDVGSLTTDETDGDVVIAGDLDTADLGEVKNNHTVTVGNVVGALDFRVDGVQYGGNFAGVTQFVFDGGTDAVSTTALGPTAIAGTDQTVSEGAVVQLNGAGSFDPDGDALTYAWAQTSGPTVVLVGGNTATPTFLAPEGLANSAVTFDLKVSDGVLTSSVDTVSITINADNDAPIANAGVDQTVAEGDGVTLTARASADPEGTGLTYLWVQTSGPAVTLSDATASQPSFRAPDGVANTAVQFELRVSDGVNLSSVDTVSITINADNDAPTADAGVDQTVAEGDVVTLSGVGSADPEAQGLTYLWVQTSGPAVTLSDATAAQPTFTAPEGLANTAVQFTLRVHDGINTSSLDTVSITINRDNDAPTSNAGVDQTVAEGDVVTLTGVGSADPEAQGLTYTWVQTSGPAVTLSNPGAAQPTFTAPEGLANTAVQFQLTVSDGVNSSSLDTVSITINRDDDAPTANAGVDQTVNEAEVVTLTGLASVDPEAQGLTYTWVQTSGPAITLSDASAAQPTFTAPTVAVNTVAQFELRVSDGVNTSSVDTVAVTINAPAAPLDLAPTANAGVDQTVAEGDLVTLTGLASVDPEAQALTYTWVQTSGPTVTLSNCNAAQPTFTAPEGLANTTVQFELRVSDGVNTSVADPVSITINRDDDAPTANAGVDQTVDEGGPVMLNGLASADPEAQGLTYTWVQTAGPAVTLSNPNAAQPTFTAPEGLANTSVQFELRVTDGVSTSSADTVSVTINADDDAPTANAGIDQTVAEGDVVTLTGLLSSDPEAQGLSYTWVQTAGPAVTLSNASAAQPTFTAPEGLANTAVSFELRVSDGVNTSSVDTVSVTINADNDAPTANAGVDQTVAEGAVVTLTSLASVDPENQGLSYTWVQTAGPAVTLSNASAAQPTFTAPEGLANTAVSFQLSVSDGVNVTSVDSVSITINRDNDAPTANAGADQTVDEGDVVTLTGIASADPEAQGLSYTWVQTAGPAVVLSDANACEPTFTAPEGLANTAVQFQLQVSDGVSTSSVDTVSITINRDDDAPTAEAGSNQSVAEGAVVTLTGLASTDPEAQGLTYTWTQTAGPAVTLSNANAAQPTFTAPDGVANSAIRFELRVSDGVSTSSADTVWVLVNCDNDAPSANAGSDQTVDEGDFVLLDGRSSSDPEGQGLTYTWVQTSGPTVTLNDANVARPLFRAPEGLTNTAVTFELRVSDGTNTSSVDTVTVTINRDDDAPKANAGSNQSVAEGDVVRLNGQASSDPEGQGLTYSWVQTGGPAVTLDDATSPQPTFTAPEGLVNTAVTFRLQVSDGTQVVTGISTGISTGIGSLGANLSIGNTSYDTVTIVVNADDDAPTVDAGATQQAEVGEAVLLHAEAQDPEGRQLTYTWRQVSGPTVTMANASGCNLVFQAPVVTANEAVVFEVSVTDGTNTTVDTVTVQVDPNSAPDLSVSAPGSVLAGDSAMVRATATDAEGDTLRYHWTQISGPSVMLSGTSNDRATFTAPDVLRPTEVQFQVAVTDGRSITTQTISVTIMPDLTEAPQTDAPAEAQLEPTTPTTSTTPTNGTPPATSTPGNSSSTGSSTSTTSPGPSTEPSQTTSGSGTPPTSQAGEPAPGPSWQPEVDAGSDQRVAEGALVRLGARADFVSGAVRYVWTQVAGPTVLLAGAQSANPTFVAPDATSNYSVEFRVTASDGTTVVSDLVTVSVAADNEVPLVSALANVLAEAGAEVQVATGIVDPDANQTAIVKQTGGTPVVVGGLQAGNLIVRTPEFFAEEELTFTVEYMSNGERVVQEVRFSVQPVHSTGRADTVAETTEFEDHPTSHDDQAQAQRGVGKVWASLVAFTGMSQGRQKN